MRILVNINVKITFKLHTHSNTQTKYDVFKLLFVNQRSDASLETVRNFFVIVIPEQTFTTGDDCGHWIEQNGEMTVLRQSPGAKLIHNRDDFSWSDGFLRRDDFFSII